MDSISVVPMCSVVTVQGLTLGSRAGSFGLPDDTRNLYRRGERSEVGQVRINLPSCADLPLETWEVPEGWLGPRRCTLWAHLFKTLALRPVLFRKFSLRIRRGYVK